MLAIEVNYRRKNTGRGALSKQVRKKQCGTVFQYSRSSTLTIREQTFGRIDGEVFSMVGADNALLLQAEQNLVQGASVYAEKGGQLLLAQSRHNISVAAAEQMHTVEHTTYVSKSIKGAQPK